ncbi:MAG: hypothetical protein WC484_06660 [Candidatus Omnitrophota bacterium]|nr:hypothetical protein [Methanoregula sp.]
MVFISFLDITGRKRAERTVRDEEKKFALAFTHGAGGFCISTLPKWEDY